MVIPADVWLIKHWQLDAERRSPPIVIRRDDRLETTVAPDVG